MPSEYLASDRSPSTPKRRPSRPSAPDLAPARATHPIETSSPRRRRHQHSPAAYIQRPNPIMIHRPAVSDSSCLVIFFPSFSPSSFSSFFQPLSPRTDLSHSVLSHPDPTTSSITLKVWGQDGTGQNGPWNTRGLGVTTWSFGNDHPSDHLVPLT